MKIDSIIRDLKKKLDVIVKEADEHAKETQKSFKDDMIRSEQLIQKYAEERDDQTTLEESKMRMEQILQS